MISMQTDRVAMGRIAHGQDLLNELKARFVGGKCTPIKQPSQ